MAILDQNKLAQMRRRIAFNNAVTWDKQQVNAALQAIENVLQGNVGALNNAIESTSPGVFTTGQKKLIFANAALNFAAVSGAK